MNIFSFIKCLGQRLRKGFTLAEILIALAILAVIVVLVIPVITTRAHNKTFALSFESEVKQMLNSLEALPVYENKDDFTKTMMYITEDLGMYSDSAGAYINKYMKVAKYCGDAPGDCFASEYYQYKNNDRVSFDISLIKGACALLKNGVSVCLKPQIKSANGTAGGIEGWLDLNGPKPPNVYGRDLRTFFINLKDRQIIPEGEPGKAIFVDPPKPCEGDDCGKIETDPCKINPFGKECCTREGFVAVGEGDRCCIWYADESTASNPNHKICFPDKEPDPCPEDGSDPSCLPEKCSNHVVTGPSDECCEIFKARGIKDPNCCSATSSDEYCCSIRPDESAACCMFNINAGNIPVNPNSKCCKSFKQIYDLFPQCQGVCERDYNSQECCETKERRDKITGPEDSCCAYSVVNGIDEKAVGNNYNQYCCRLPQYNSLQCCQWKTGHLDYYANYSEQNATSDHFDGCCHDNTYGIKSNNSDILSRCCRMETIQSNAQEDELCCDYLVAQNGNDKLKYGQLLRHCCKYSKHKNKPECCSNTTDGMAYDSSVNWAAQCCMPNSIYDNDVTPNIQCCFAVPNAQGETNKFWQNKRLEGCCSYGDQTYGSGKANQQAQWQLNCCDMGFNKYPNINSFNKYCCKSTSGNRFTWINNDCCSTLITENHNNNGLDAWKVNCCHMPEDYGTNAVYRTNCCSEKTTDFTRNNGSDVQKEKEHCCHPDAPEPAEECCTIFKNNAPADDKDKWLDRDGNQLSDAYKISCCQKYGICPESCAIRSKTNNAKGQWDLPRCCKDADMQTAHMDDATWQGKCCDGGADGKSSNNTLSDNDFRSYCCKSPGTNVSTKDYVSNDKRCCSNADGSKKLRSDYCCDNVPSSKDDEDSIGAYCKCGRAAETWNIVNTKYSSDCCSISGVISRLGYNSSNSSSDDAGMPPFVKDWQTKCCTNSAVHTSTNNDIRTPHYLYCCNSGGAYSAATDWSNTTCCYNADSSANTAENEGKDWNGTFTSKCCSFTVANKTCCKAFKDNGWKTNTGSSPSEEFKIACCELSADGEDYCESCAIRAKVSKSSLWDLPTCCFDSTMKSNHMGKTAWQQKCCSQATSSNNKMTDSEYRQYCCSDGVGNSKHSGNDARCCVNTSGVKGVSQFCCANINDCAHCSCEDRWETRNSCFNGKTDCYCSTKFKNENEWKNTCCKYDEGTTSGTSGLEESIFPGVCCKPTTDNGTGAIWGGTNKSACCSKFVYGNACCGASGKRHNGVSDEHCCDPNASSPTLTCCSAFKNNNWKDFEGNDISDTYQIACCNLRDTYCKDCSIRAKSDSKRWNLPTCCFNETMKNNKDKATWQSACCSTASSNYGTDSRNISDADFKSYCCSPKDNNDTGDVKGGGTNAAACCNKFTAGKSACCASQGKKYNNANSVACCSYDGSAKATATCCDEAQNNNWADSTSGSSDDGSNSYGGSVFRQKCCDMSDEYCSCEMLYQKIKTNGSGTLPPSCCITLKSAHQTEDLWADTCCQPLLTNSQPLNSKCCQKLMTQYYTNSHYQTQCCKHINTGGIGTNGKQNFSVPNSAFKTYCCNPNSGNSSGSVKGNATNKAVCCSSYEVGKACCGANGKDWQNNSQTSCCSFSSEPNQTCCQAASNNSWTGASDSYRGGCCSLDDNFCTCPMKLAKGYTSEQLETSGCCQGETGALTGNDWVNGCCSVSNINSAGTLENHINCCKKLHNTLNKNSTDFKSLFGPGLPCCGAYDNFDECVDRCNPAQNKNLKIDANYYHADAEYCCGSGPTEGQHQMGDSAQWATYCCGLRKQSSNSPDEFMFSTENNDVNPLCCPKRLSSTGVYHYVPSYANNACVAGGVTGKCSGYYDPSSGFYCGPDKCEYWLNTGENGVLGDAEQIECCISELAAGRAGNYSKFTERCPKCKIYLDPYSNGTYYQRSQVAFANFRTVYGGVSETDHTTCCDYYYNNKSYITNYKAKCCIKDKSTFTGGVGEGPIEFYKKHSCHYEDIYLINDRYCDSACGGGGGSSINPDESGCDLSDAKCRRITGNSASYAILSDCKCYNPDEPDNPIDYTYSDDFIPIFSDDGYSPDFGGPVAGHCDDGAGNACTDEKCQSYNNGSKCYVAIDTNGNNRKDSCTFKWSDACCAEKYGTGYMYTGGTTVTLPDGSTAPCSNSQSGVR